MRREILPRVISAVIMSWFFRESGVVCFHTNCKIPYRILQFFFIAPEPTYSRRAWKAGMTDAERKTLKTKIVAEIERTSKDIEGLEEITQPVGAEDMDDITRMDSIVNKSVNDAALAAARTRLAKLEYALKRIDDPEFGYCVECGEAIPVPRLLAMPEAAHCVDCAD